MQKSLPALNYFSAEFHMGIRDMYLDRNKTLKVLAKKPQGIYSRLSRGKTARGSSTSRKAGGPAKV